MLSITNIYGQAPYISYATPVNVYTVGTAITPLVPTNTGGSVSTTTLATTSVSGPSGMGLNPAGNLYVTQYTNASVTYYNSSVTYIGTFGSGFTNPDGIVFDAAGNAYIVDAGAGSVFKITTGGVKSTFVSGLTNPLGIGIDASGNIFVAVTGSNQIKKYSSAGALLLTITTSISSPTDVRVDASGNIYVLDYGTNRITKYTSAGVYSSIFASGFNGPYTMFIGSTGNVYVGDSGNNKVIIYNSAGTVLNTISVTDPEGITTDASGDIFVSSYSGNKIYEYPPMGGYTISGSLPTGLSFSTTTGTISGTPTASSAATNYTITAYNTIGSSSCTISIAVGNTVAWLGFTSTAWTTGTNWSTASPPGVNDAVSIGVSAYTGVKAEPLITTAVTVGSITFGNNGGSHNLTVNSPGALTIGGSLTIPTGVTPTIKGTGAINIAAAGMVNVNGTGVLTLTQPISFTLMSTASGSASVGQITTSSIAGTAADSIHVQRYLTGGAGYRGYRLLSSPVYAATISSNNVYNLNYLHDRTFLTGTSGVGNGFDQAGNPTLYLFREDKVPSNANFTSGNFWGISNITPNAHSTNSYSVTGGNPSTTSSFNIPAANGFMLFFRGDRTTVSPYVTTTAPVASTITATGTLNAGTIVVHDWYTPASANIGYTIATANSAVRGYNLVGNPYPSSIDWSTFSNSNPAASIYGLNVNPTIYILNPVTKNYDTYNAATSLATGSATKIIPSGQGFFIQANLASPSLTFNESAKINAQVTGSNLLMGAPATQSAYNSYLRIKLITDTINNSDIIIGFNNTSSAKFNGNEDSEFHPGSGSLQTVAAISSDSIYTAEKWVPFPKSTTSQVIRLNITARATRLYTLQRTDFKSIPQIYRVWLMDKYKKDSLDIRNNSTYAFDIDIADTASYGSNRFQVIVRQDPALMVHLLNFTATKVQSGSQAVWVTENEQNYTNFTVERSVDGGATYKILGCTSASGLGTYSYLDKSPESGANLYRLKIVDLNGTTTYSNIVTLMYSNAPTLSKTSIIAYPNPVKTLLNLNIATGFNSNSTSGLSTSLLPVSYTVAVSNISGTVVIKATTTQQSWQADVSAFMPGTYVITVVNNKNKTTVGQATFIKL
ncbi:putative Ig domain-containing protein [Mucilaginibacter sp.]|uniref:putative Ig domain-containing protein n=1 Tax=Mucilaginibacter sp. TaxID=1882438 RepID=UPI00283B2881|nr:putative Ig domain-containing protein [Mucilaginibacter sp.]MDR3693257.1 putative Ig domain-containing protein [Mucilaginibacter sp.]